MARQADVVANTPILSTWGNTVRDRSVVPFVNAAERTSQWPSPPEGAVSYLADVDTVYVYTGAAWSPVATLVPREDATRVQCGGNRSTGSAVDVNWNGTETCVINFTKQRADTAIILEIAATAAETSGFSTYFTVNVSGGTGDLADIASVSRSGPGDSRNYVGWRKVTGLPAGAYTFTLRWKTSGGSSVTVDDYACLKVMETL